MFNTTLNWKRVRLALVTTLCALATGLTVAPRIAADSWDRKTIVTFSGPVEVPGKVLPAGTYVFKLLDSSSNRNIVQIFDKDEKHLYATLLAVPDYRLTPSDKPLILFEERPAGSPEAVKAWYYPGDNYGQEFVYPHKRATELARQTHHGVLSMNDEMANNTSTQATSASDSGIKQMQNTEVTGVTPEGNTVDMIVIIASKPNQQ